MGRKFRILIGLLVLFVGGYLYLRATARTYPPCPWFAPRPGQHRPLVLAHQGGEGVWPCNTMLAFRESRKIGSDVLDLDVHLSRDGQLVVIHDDKVDRTTDGHGLVAAKTVQELKKLDAGYRFTTDKGASYPYRGQGVTIPTLEEVFQEFPEVLMGIEIKPRDAAAGKALAEFLIKHNKAQDALISCFHEEAMAAFRQACPESPTSATPREVTTFMVYYRLGLIELYTPTFSSLQIPEEKNGWKLMTPELVAAAHSRGVAVVPWTINEVPDLQRVRGTGVEGINTNFPNRLLNLLEGK